MQATLTPEQERLVRSQIQTGNYETPEDAIVEVFRLLEDRNRLLVGSEEMKQGKVTDGKIVFERLQKRLRSEFGLEE